MLWLCIRLPALLREALATSEREALERLAAWAYQWSGLVSYRRSEDSEDGQLAPLLWLELGASRALFGEPAALLATLSAALTQLGYTHACAIAPSPAAAALLTRTGRQPCLVTPAQLRAGLTALPLEWLELPVETLSALRSAGLRHIGEVLALPAAALARRFGPACCRYLLRLSGAAGDPLPAFRLPAVYRARCEFDYELRETTGLLFPLQRLLQEFQGYLRSRDRCVQRFTLELAHHRGRNIRDQATRVSINLSVPDREASRFLLLVRERLQGLTLSAPVCAVTLRAEEFTAPAIAQADLFAGEQPQLGALPLLLDRLRARLGDKAVQGLQLQADHRPERACRLVQAHTMVPHTAAPGGSRAQTAASAAARPAALWPTPQRIAPPAALLSGPERIETGWWDGAEVRRDYYIAQGAEGARQWVFHDLCAGGWYLQGLWV